MRLCARVPQNSICDDRPHGEKTADSASSSENFAKSLAGIYIATVTSVLSPFCRIQITVCQTV
jgi:hypothetical protein